MVRVYLALQNSWHAAAVSQASLGSAALTSIERNTGQTLLVVEGWQDTHSYSRGHNSF